ncbi:MAG: chromate transporter [Lachnospiraceae bacterium]|nr:chromate transporter [Lachnospiraceae bacterium]
MKPENERTLGRLFLKMALIGLAGFGGGSALIPLFEKVTADGSLISREDLDRDIIVANITPGALPVEIASGLGKQFLGRPGMVCAAGALTLPGVLFTILILVLFSVVPESLLLQIRYLSLGVSAGIIGLLFQYIGRVWTDPKNGNLRTPVIAVSLIVFLLACGKNLRKLLPLPGDPLFAWSTLKILITAFIVILLYSLFRRIREHSGTEKIAFSFSLRDMILDLTAWMLFMVFLSVPAFLVMKGGYHFQARGFISSLLSFGGGDAFLTIAEGLFVQTDMVAEDYFYSQLIPVTNVIPGSILCKMLAGCGYFLGFHQHGSILQGILMAVSGAAVGIAASGMTFHFVDHLYGMFSHLPVFTEISRWIRPIIAGLLFNIALSLLTSNINMAGTIGCSRAPLWLLSATLPILYVFLVGKKHLSTGKTLVILALLGIAAGNLLAASV